METVWENWPLFINALVYHKKHAQSWHLQCFGDFYFCLYYLLSLSIYNSYKTFQLHLLPWHFLIICSLLSSHNHWWWWFSITISAGISDGQSPHKKWYFLYINTFWIFNAMEMQSYAWELDHLQCPETWQVQGDWKFGTANHTGWLHAAMVKILQTSFGVQWHAYWQFKKWLQISTAPQIHARIVIHQFPHNIWTDWI